MKVIGNIDEVMALGSQLASYIMATGTMTGGRSKWLAGEKCREVLDKINKVALWIVP